jgi:hypothetical protein
MAGRETDVDDAQLARIHGAGYLPAIAVGAQRHGLYNSKSTARRCMVIGWKRH